MPTFSNNVSSRSLCVRKTDDYLIKEDRCFNEIYCVESKRIYDDGGRSSCTCITPNANKEYISPSELAVVDFSDQLCDGDWCGFFVGTKAFVGKITNRKQMFVDSPRITKNSHIQQAFPLPEVVKQTYFCADFPRKDKDIDRREISNFIKFYLLYPEDLYNVYNSVVMNCFTLNYYLNNLALILTKAFWFNTTAYSKLMHSQKCLKLTVYIISKMITLGFSPPKQLFEIMFTINKNIGVWNV